jgi:hypothetical protein
MNVTILASLFLNGFCAYLLAWRVTGDRGAAIIGGLTFGGSSYLSGHLHGHFNLTGAWTVPLFAMTALEAMKGRKAWAFAAGIVLAATAYNDYYYLILECVLGSVIVAAALGDWSVTFQGRGSAARTRATRIVAGLTALAAIVHRRDRDYRRRGVQRLGPDHFDPWPLQSAADLLVARCAVVVAQASAASLGRARGSTGVSGAHHPDHDGDDGGRSGAGDQSRSEADHERRLRDADVSMAKRAKGNRSGHDRDRTAVPRPRGRVRAQLVRPPRHRRDRIRRLDGNHPNHARDGRTARATGRRPLCGSGLQSV